MFLGARNVYVLSQLVYTGGALVIAVSRHRLTAMLLSPCAGVMYATLFTMPYMLVAQYHTDNVVSDSAQYTLRSNSRRKCIA